MSTDNEAPRTDLGLWGDDEKHIAAALYLLQKAIALKEQEGYGMPTLHACLRDASYHCEMARRHWTKEKMEELAKVAKLFPPITKNEAT